jgi:hypothetical protein
VFITKPAAVRCLLRDVGVGDDEMLDVTALAILSWPETFVAMWCTASQYPEAAVSWWHPLPYYLDKPSDDEGSVRSPDNPFYQVKVKEQ